MRNSRFWFGMGAGALLAANAEPVSAQGGPVLQSARAAYVAPAGLAGRVTASDTRAPLNGVRVTVEGADAFAFTSADGRFRIEDLTPGNYTLLFEFLRYRPQARTDVIVRPDRTTYVDVALDPAPVRLAEIVARADYFPRRDEQPSSRVAFSAEEIRRAPGSAGDVSRILMGLPALAKVNDQSNALIVRGGSPFENVFLVDGIEIPNINHFPTQGASGGPIGLLNVDLIDDVELYAGAFPARYGDRLSSVMDLRLREGNRGGFEGQVDLNFAGFGGVLEGPLPGGRGAWVASARRSYLDLLVNMIDIGTTIAPRFGDFQAKVTVDPAQDHRLSIVAVAADDHSRSDLATAIENAMVQYGRQDIMQGTAGVNWSALWSERLWSSTAFSVTASRFRENFLETASNAPLFDNRSSERELRVRNVNRLQLGERSSLEFGTDAKSWTGNYDNTYAERTGPLGDTVAELRLDRRLAGATVGVFTSWTFAPAPPVTATLGLRADRSSVGRRTHLAPRASLAYRATERTMLNAAAGLYHQTLPLVLLAQDEAHQRLRDPAAIHYVLGVEHLLAADTRLTVEAYHKRYRNLPLDPDHPALFPLDELFYDFTFFTGHERLTDDGRASASGVEALLQKKLSRSVYGVVSGAYARARYRGGDGEWRDRVFDNRFLFSAEGGYKPGASWEFSARWMYAGGPPYTPLDTEASEARNRAVLDRDRINGARYPDYHSLNVRADRRFHFTRSNLIAYASVWNVYNRQNVASYYWNADENRPDVIRQWGMLPIIGFELEF